MATVISNNVIKISTGKSSAETPTTNSQYPRTCDYCRDTYNSELTYNRHKEIGKCFRFCRLREEKRLRQAKTPRTSIYPRQCNKCSKVYKNKHSYYKHKSRCVGGFGVEDASNDEINKADVYSTSLLVGADIDVVELDSSGIENIPVTDNKENIDDFTSNFILTLDVDKNFSDDLSLYPRICEICHKVFKTQDRFELHKVNTKCAGIEVIKKRPPQPPPVKKVRPTSIHFRRCGNCNKVISHKQLYNNHIKRCGKTSMSTVPVLKQAFDFVPIVQPSDSHVSAETPAVKPSPKQLSYSRFCDGCGVIFGSKRAYCQHYCSLKNKSCHVERTSVYPRTCEHCEFSFRTKYQFHRHKVKCSGYVKSRLDEEDDTFVSCDYCFKKFDTYLLYRQHMKSFHPEVQVLIMPVRHKYKYPRKCPNCLNVYATRQTFCNHKKRCTPSLDRDFFKIDSESFHDLDEELNIYPRTCTECLHTYSNRQSFCNHRRLCQKFVASLALKGNLYPRRCEYCSKIYSSKQTYHHHKDRCPNFGQKSARMPMYPRTCVRCDRTFAYKQSYHKHLKTCQYPPNSVHLEEDRNNDENMDQSDLDYEPLPTPSSQHERKYPRMCELCRKIYANRHTYSKHKLRCVPITPLVNITEDSDTSVQAPSESFFYPRECENCLGTFQNEATFNAHKIRCDFFETKVNESEFKSYIKSSCEHCRNIVNQYRRIFHQHLEQCTDPIIVTPDPPLTTEHESAPNKISHLNGEANFCECCGMFFETREQIELHRKSLKSSENTALPECNICMEIFDSEDELEVHKRICILNPSNRTYPRFCECCRKVYKTKQTFYNHKKNCHVHCLKYFVLKDCDNCKLPFKCEKMYMEHVQECVPFGDGDIAAECEVSVEPIDGQIGA